MVSRQIYHKRKLSNQVKGSCIAKVIELVNHQRVLIPRLNVRKLYYLLNNELKALKIGRDKLFYILKVNQMLIKPKRSYYITTNSKHWLKNTKTTFKILT